MNEKLQACHDGTGKPGDPPTWFKTACQVAGIGQRMTSETFGEIWWPFAIHFDVATDLESITHLPSGYGLGNPITLKKARATVQALRKLDLDWNFTEPKGAKWDAVKVEARPTLEKFGVLKKRIGSLKTVDAVGQR